MRSARRQAEDSKGSAPLEEDKTFGPSSAEQGKRKVEEIGANAGRDQKRIKDHPEPKYTQGECCAAIGADREGDRRGSGNFVINVVRQAKLERVSSEMHSVNRTCSAHGSSRALR